MTTESMHIITLDQDALQWAVHAADESIARWGARPGHYRNQLTSHLVGRLGEVAAERFFQERGLAVRAHFHFPEREAMCDLEVIKPPLRLDVKTWSTAYWNDLGRSVAVNQFRCSNARPMAS